MQPNCNQFSSSVHRGIDNLIKTHFYSQNNPIGLLGAMIISLLGTFGHFLAAVLVRDGGDGYGCGHFSVRSDVGGITSIE